MAEECADDDDDKATIVVLRKAILRELNLHASVLQVPPTLIPHSPIIYLFFGIPPPTTTPASFHFDLLPSSFTPLQALCKPPSRSNLITAYNTYYGGYNTCISSRLHC